MLRSFLIVFLARGESYSLDVPGRADHNRNIRRCEGLICLESQAVADEDGNVTLIDTSIPKNSRTPSSTSFPCHRNAIFDVAFTGSCT